MIRIRTKNGNISVFTLWFPQTMKWITIRSITGADGKVTTSSSDAPNFFEAGQNHLRQCGVSQ